MPLPLAPTLKLGIQTIHRRTEPAPGAAAAPWLPTIAELETLVRLVDNCGYDSLWTGDHVAFAVPIFDPLLQLAQAAVVSRRLTLGTNVYLVPLRHPVPIAKQVATLDHLCEGRLIFGVGVGGEFPREFEASGVPHNQRGARLSEAIPVMRRLWSGEAVTHHGGRYPAFSDVTMLPPARQPGGPPIWCGGRADAALARTGRLADGWISYVVTPETYRAALGKIEAEVEQAGRALIEFGTGHLLFARLDASYERALDAATETLSRRYAMDFRRAAERYAALGTAEQVAVRIREFHAVGARHIVLDLVGPYEERPAQIEAFAREVMPLLSDLRR
ncbi:MAG: TIGR03619 family F420-dependent LLM class oxidoreductase [Alphaproteobacteria bacterium]|nr:TIGR03619 family F420-dependent LLM class oxidoreductase [Alphaproteobacteria bacterium]